MCTGTDHFGIFSQAMAAFKMISSFWHHIRALFHHRDFWLMWTLREIQIRYKQSLLGAAWALLQPLSLMVIFSAIFGYLLKVESGGIPYPLFVYSSLLPWTFFANAINNSVPSLINNLNLVTKIYFPREILPLAGIGAAFIDFLVGAALYIFLMVIYGVPARLVLVWIPILIIVQMLLTIGVSLIASTVIVFLRDVRFVVPLVLQVWMYLSPVIYPLETIPEKWRGLYLLNPMAALIDGYRRIILYGTTPQWQYLLPGVALSVIIFFGGYLFFKRMEPVFADII
jgi:lipopolysaccharide transport system permease protein